MGLQINLIHGEETSETKQQAHSKKPRGFGCHHDRFRIVASLQNLMGLNYKVNLSKFVLTLQMQMVHVAIDDGEEHAFAQRHARGLRTAHGSR